MAYDKPDSPVTQTATATPDKDEYDTIAERAAKLAEKTATEKAKLFYDVETMNQATAQKRTVKRPRLADEKEHKAALDAIESELLTTLESTLKDLDVQEKALKAEIEHLEQYDFWVSLTPDQLNQIAALSPLIKSDVDGDQNTLIRRVKAAIAANDVLRMALYDRFITDAKRARRQFSKDVLLLNIDYGEKANPNAGKIAEKKARLDRVIATIPKVRSVHTNNSSAAKSRMFKVDF